MAGVLDILFNAAGGGVVGSLLHLGTSWFETYRKRKEAEVEIMLLQAKVNAAEKEAAWNAFAKSQEAEGRGGLQALPERTHPIMVNVFVGVDAFRQVTRPLLCWFGVLLLAGVYFNAPLDHQATMQDEMQFGAWTMVFWFFGARYSKPQKR